MRTLSTSCAELRERLGRGATGLNYPYDLHVHTDFSDGKDSVSLMARTAAMYKLEVVAITDHLRDSVFPCGKSFGDYSDAIEAARAQCPDLTILKGVEGSVVDVAGRISIPEEYLERFDLVLVDFGGMAKFREYGVGAAGSRSRFLCAVMDCFVALCAHPSVDIVAHPFNFGRLAPGFSFDWFPDGALREIASCFVEHETCFEIMNDIWWWFPDMNRDVITRDYARLLHIFDETGVRFTVGSDSHHHQGVGNMNYIRVLFDQLAGAPEHE